MFENAKKRLKTDKTEEPEKTEKLMICKIEAADNVAKAHKTERPHKAPEGNKTENTVATTDGTEAGKKTEHT